MAAQKPSKPNVVLPNNFGGVKTPYTQAQIDNGYQEAVPQVVDGGNINYEKDAVFQKLKYLESVADAVNNIPPGKFLVVNSNNQFEYADSTVKSSFGNIGDIEYTSRTDVPHGGAWCDGALYTKAQFPDVYQMLVDGKLQSTTVSEFDSSVSANGSCGFFGLDTANERFKVPLLKDVYLKAGQAPLAFGAETLPNITGTFRGRNAYNGNASINKSVVTGAFGTRDESGTKTGAQESGTNSFTWTFDASRSSSTYQDGAKVNPDHVTYRAYVVLYASAVEASAAQAQEFMTALSGKASVALDNVSPAQSFKDMSIGWGMPDYSAGIDVTSEFSAGQWWTSTKKGYYIIATGDQSYFEIRTNSSGDLIIAGSGPTPYILSNSFFIADVGEKFYVTKKSGNYTKAVYYPFKE